MRRYRPSSIRLGTTAVVGCAVLALAWTAASAAATQPIQTAVTTPRTASEVPGPLPGALMTEDYARATARAVYVWAWTMMNIHNRSLIDYQPSTRDETVQ